MIKNAEAKDIYESLLNSAKHSKLIEDIVKLDPKIGGEFSVFSGYATGEILELLKNKKIRLKWCTSNWELGIFYEISFKISDSTIGAVISFIQKDLPQYTKWEFEAGWEDFYWKPIRNYFRINR